MRSHGVRNWDVSVFKNFQLTSKATLQFRAEAFNLFDRVQIQFPDQIGRIRKEESEKWETDLAREFKIIVEKHLIGYVAYPLGLKGVVVGEGETYEEALSDAKSAIKFHLETFGDAVLESESTVLEAYVAETTLDT